MKPKQNRRRDMPTVDQLKAELNRETYNSRFKSVFFSTVSTLMIVAAAAVLVAFSRMYLYVHYPTDVIAAAVLGVFLGYLGAMLGKRIHARFAKE